MWLIERSDRRSAALAAGRARGQGAQEPPARAWVRSASGRGSSCIGLCGALRESHAASTGH